MTDFDYQREALDAELTGLYETLVDLGVDRATVDRAVAADGTDREVLTAVLREHTPYRDFASIPGLDAPAEPAVAEQIAAIAAEERAALG